MKNKYLLLLGPEEPFPAMINTHMFLVMEMLLLAKKTKRIFVLPPVLSQPRDNKIAESGEVDHTKFILGQRHIPMEDIFDIDSLRKYVDIITFQDYLKISKSTISTLYCFGNEHGKKVRSYDREFTVQVVRNTKDINEIINSNDQFVAVTGYQAGKYLVPSSPNWPKEYLDDYWRIRKHIRYNKTLDRKADRFIKKHKLNDYIAVHWRRGDRVHPEVSELAEQIVREENEMKKRIDDFLVNPIKKIMRKYKLTKVFLATNSGTEWHLEYLKSKLPITMYPPSGNWEDREEESIIEQIICIKADYFFAAPFTYRQCSSFSRWIIDSRIVEGKKNTSAHQLKMQSSVFLARMHLMKDELLRIAKPPVRKVVRILPASWRNRASKTYLWLKGKS